MTGRFITLEGGEGVGKSTQLKALAEAISARGHSVITTREPGGSEGAEAIRSLLMQGGEDRWSARAEALLFAAARADHVEKLIRPALERGDWVLCDRFIDSSRAYQGGAGGLSDDDVMTLHRIGSEGMLPDRTLVLTLPTEDARNRERARDSGVPDRFGIRDMSYKIAVEAKFRMIAQSDSARFRIIRALGTEAEVTQLLIAALDDLL